jgi:hypothetical protein
MLIRELICEDYKTAAVKFNAAADPNQVQKAITQYRQLVNKNQVQGNERNIDYWAKQGWDKFSQFVQSKSSTPTTTQIKRKKSVGQSITLFENDKWLVVIPLNHDASCYHGRNTQWCTARPNRGNFDRYFLKKDVVLIYCLDKQTGEKWAIANHKNLKKVEYFNKDNQSIDAQRFQQQTGLDPKKLIAMIPHNDTRITTARQNRKELLTLLKTRMSAWEKQGTFNRDIELEKLLAQVKLDILCLKYITQVGKHHGPQEYTGIIGQSIMWAAITYEEEDADADDNDTYGYEALQYIKNPNEALQLAAIKENADVIKYIENPSEAVQLAAIKENADVIKYIENPSEAVQLAAVEQDTVALQYIKNPSEAVQWAAVKQNGRAIEYIKNPSEEMQLVAVKQNGRAIEYIKKPSEAVQLAAVNQKGSAITYIKFPSEAVQLAAVKQDGNAIEYIKKPSEAVQLAAVNQKGSAIYYLIKKRIEPSEAVQLAAVNKYGEAIKWIKNPTPRVLALARSKGVDI